MKKSYKGWLTAAVLLTAVGMATGALAEVWLEPLTTGQMAMRGATHKVEVEAADLSVSAGASQTNTVSIAGPCAWQWIGWELAQPFDDTKQAATTNSVVVSYAIDAVSLVSAVQCAEDGTISYRGIFPTGVTVTMTGLDATNTIAGAGEWVYAGTLAAGSTATVSVVVAPVTNALNTGSCAGYFRIWP